MKSLIPVGAALAFALGACTKEPLAVRSTQSQTFKITVGQELDLTVGTVGPGQYEAPPSISSNALQFLDAAIVGPYTPGGPQQLFRFKGQTRGTAVVVIQHSSGGPTIQDTVDVR